jgi:hypothetical protein
VNQVLSGLAGLLSLICWIILLIDAFKSAIWKGILMLFCFPYMIIYVIIDCKLKYKWLYLIGALLGGGLGYLLTPKA